MRANPLVSTVIPTFNRASILGDAIESVRQQSYQEIEIIVVDDGSTDDTQARLKAYGPSVRVIVQPNAGPASARNRGIEAARGDIIAFLDSDDTWHRTKLERQVRLLQRAGSSITCCICNAAMVFPDGREVPTFAYSHLAPSLDEGVWENVAEVLATRFLLFVQTAAIRRDVLERIGGFDETLRFHEDYEFPLRLALEGAWGYIRDPLVRWRQESVGSYTATAYANELQLLEGDVEWRRKLFEKVAGSERHRALRPLFLRQLKATHRALRASQWRESGRAVRGLCGKSMLLAHRYRAALYRRSPWYPQMKVVPLNGGNASTTKSRTVEARAASAGLTE